MSLVNLGIFLGEKNPGYFFFFFFKPRGKKEGFLPSRFSQVLIALHYVALCLEQAPSPTSKRPGRGPKPMWLQASGSSAQQIAAALEETDRNPELRNLLHLQKAEKLTVSGLVVLKVFSNTVFLPSLKPLLKKKKVILSSGYLREKKKKSGKYTTIAFYLPIAPNIESSHSWVPDGEAFNFIF